MASLPPDTVVLRADLVSLQRIPSSFGAKILRRLTGAGLLRSERGVHGGYRLARRPSRITLLHVIEAIDGPLCLTPCSGETSACEMTADCPASLAWPVIQENLRRMLDALDLEQLVSATRRQGRVVQLPGLLGLGREEGSELTFQHFDPDESRGDVEM